jgi:hypothetical protein
MMSFQKWTKGFARGVELNAHGVVLVLERSGQGSCGQILIKENKRGLDA